MKMLAASRRAIAAAALTVLVAQLAGCGSLAAMARGEPEWRVIREQPEQYGLTARRVDLRSRAGRRISAWWIAAHPDGDGRATVVLVHGRGGNRSDMLPTAKFLVAAGYDALAIDLRAHGDSEGEYLSPGYLEVEEVDTAIAYAHRASPRPVVLLGYSVGAVAVLHATSRGAPVAATIADSPFISAFDVLDRFRARLRRDGASVWPRMALWFMARRSLAGLLSWMLRSGGADAVDARRADLLPVLPRITVPVLFITGLRDDIAPTENAHEMIRAMRSRGTQIAELPASHTTHRDAPTAYEQTVLAFLARIVPPDDAVPGARGAIALPAALRWSRPHS